MIPPNSTVLLEENFLTIQECDELIQSSSPYLEEALIYDRNSEKYQTLKEFRSCCQTVEYLGDKHEVFGSVAIRIANLLCVSQELCEPVKVVRYRKGDYFRPHFDAFGKDYLDGLDEFDKHGQRVNSVIIYLNDEYSGGETYFQELGIKIEPSKGAMLIINNVDGNGNINPLSLHEGREITSGEKWIAVCWIRDK
ncbi:hypothetical protein BTJ40_04980 [Microbulbifer sp. A4B17]|uniref:prolyl hydroxylase family protein n=1 Tax=Microbulbifer sp. A4B17 TaxID=359370 RepID=UPI000D52BE58|nr:2OG-Fe(II) oxygenase [Microbulbifer sp. A4B17]AWF80215.1 hypothetical protein BTJ40_04980 [Microbulbifer sp. A4B17]